MKVELNNFGGVVITTDNSTIILDREVVQQIKDLPSKEMTLAQKKANDMLTVMDGNKEYALAAVNEILSLNPALFWENVKHEIDKL